MIADAKARSTNEKVRYQWEFLLGPRYCDSILQKPDQRNHDARYRARPKARLVEQARDWSQAAGATASGL